MTAVEWLCKQYHLKQDIEIVKQAKEMEKDQIIEAYDKGEFNCGMNGTSEEYYNKTFKI
jgi:hypothetical protein